MAKKKIRFNFVDVLIIIAIVSAVLAVVGAVSSGGDEGDASSVSIRYVIRADGITDGLASGISAGDKLYSDDGRVFYGTVAEIEIRPTYHNGINKESGESVSSVVEGKESVYITVTADAETVGKSYYVDGSGMFVGKQFSVASEKLTVDCECIGITILD